MEVREFVLKYVKAINQMLEDGIITGIDEDELGSGEFTFSFNIAMYKVAEDNNFSIRPEEPTGRGGYSDISVVDFEDEKKKLFEIEHENVPTENNLNKSLSNLAGAISPARTKLIFTYWSDRHPRDKVKERFAKLVKRHPGLDSNVFLLLAFEEFSKEREFELLDGLGNAVDFRPASPQPS